MIFASLLLGMAVAANKNASMSILSPVRSQLQTVLKHLAHCHERLSRGERHLVPKADGAGEGAYERRGCCGKVSGGESSDRRERWVSL